MSVTAEQQGIAGLQFHRAGPAEAAGMVEVIHAAFGARPALDPPSTAAAETAESVAEALAGGAGLLVTVDGRPAGSVIISAAPVEVADQSADENGETGPGALARFQRVSVHPDFQGHGVATVMVAEAELLAADLGFRRVEIYARVELPELIDYWRHRGFSDARADDHGLWLDRSLPVRTVAQDAEAMHRLGRRLADALRGGDLIILSGALGAGKTTLTQGIGAGLESDGSIISPTFVISRRHRSRTGRPTLVHVDAYRLGSAAELDDLGLDDDVAETITVVEWGEQMAEMLAADRLEVIIERAAAGRSDAAGDPRTVWIDAVGDGWRGARFDALAEQIHAGTGGGPQ